MPVPQVQPHITPNGGDAAMKKRKSLPVSNIVKTMKVGNTTIHFADNFVAKTPEEIEKVLDAYNAAGWVIVDDLISKGKLV